MTDTRLPERWLNDRRIQRLSSDTFVAFCNTLMWSNSNRTDGVIKDCELELIPRCKGVHAGELVEAGLLKRRRDSWLVIDFASTQRSRYQLENDDAYREREAERLRQWRAAQRDERADVRAYERTEERTEERTDERADGIGQDREGQDRTPRQENLQRNSASNGQESVDVDEGLF
jgi:hypothetical protein